GTRGADLVRGPIFAAPGLVALFAATCAVVASAAVLWLRPGAFLLLPRALPELWLSILVLYPILSAWPQEIMFRALFWRRYAGLFPSRATAYLANAALFALAHLFLWNWPAILATFAGGLVFSWAYLHAGPPARRGRNLMSATLLHAIAGWALFTAGAGAFFYHGAVAR
ncbi:MAG: CPBP family glutamic-type intramembrane protease, partial [Pseudomonadota bacterium]